SSSGTITVDGCEMSKSLLGIITVDINGEEEPNTPYKDQFNFPISSKGIEYEMMCQEGILASLPEIFKEEESPNLDGCVYSCCGYYKIYSAAGCGSTPIAEGERIVGDLYFADMDGSDKCSADNLGALNVCESVPGTEDPYAFAHFANSYEGSKAFMFTKYYPCDIRCNP
ncbi:MAG: hypothetical protein IJB79_02070, partial [Candidatus Gastranaerophilales bacterium]|nr:hypothetical protein [Candidatus Gastranaerophilales bacterium]